MSTSRLSKKPSQQIHGNSYRPPRRALRTSSRDGQNSRHEPTRPKGQRTWTASSTRWPPPQEVECNEAYSMVGRLRDFLPKWKEITQEKRILSWILVLWMPLLLKPNQSLQHAEIHWSDSKKIGLRDLVQELSAMAAIGKVPHCKGEFILRRTLEDCKRNVTITVKFLQELGFVINYEKSILTHSQTCRYLGLIYNSNAMSISIPEDKIPHLLKCITFLLRKSPVGFAFLPK
nr:unnamed protein product [Callosobruchus chinensis]